MLVKKTMPQSQELHPELQECMRQHLQTKDRIEQLVSCMTLEQLNWRPTATRWSIAENIHHLSLEYREQIPVVERLIEKGKQQCITGNGTFHHGWFGNFYCWFTEPPYRVKVPTLDRFKPTDSTSVKNFITEYRGHKEKIFQLIVSANGLHLAKLRAPVTYLERGNWSLSLGQWLRFFAIHERRHLWQIEQFILGDAHFPK